MASTYRDNIINQIDTIPESFLPDVYQMLHLLKTRFMPAGADSNRKENSTPLEGIWKGAVIDETDFTEARRSLFPYENR